MNEQALSRKDFADYEFIVEELARFARMSVTELMEHRRANPQDSLHTFPHPAGGHVFFSALGAERFYQIAQRGLKWLGSERNKHDVDAVVSDLRSVLVRRLTGSEPMTDENAHGLFASVVESLASGHRALTHYVPCSLVAHDKPDRFTIGPVTFILCKSFLLDNEPALRQHLKEGYDFLFDELQTFFSRFRWLAVVNVPACDPSVSRGRARDVIQKALDLFKLVIGTSRASQVRQGYDLGKPAASARLVSTAEGRFSISWQRNPHEAIVADDWFDPLSQNPGWLLAEAMISAHFDNWGSLAEPQQRFLDALTWFGDAVSESNAQARVLKFWIAIERGVSLKAGDNIARRAATLSSPLTGFVRQYKMCQRLQSQRGLIVHGATLRGTDYSAVAFDMEQLARKVLFNYLYLMDDLRNVGKDDGEALKTAFTQLERLSKIAEKKAQKR